MTLEIGRIYDLNALQFTGWTTGDGSGTEGYHMGDYFGSDGSYLGPDQHGIEPTFNATQKGTY